MKLLNIQKMKELEAFPFSTFGVFLVNDVNSFFNIKFVFTSPFKTFVSGFTCPETFVVSDEYKYIRRCCYLRIRKLKPNILYGTFKTYC